jgi:hypothetical protein
LGDFAGYQTTNAEYSNFLGENAGNGATDAANSNFFGQNAGYGAAGAYQSNFMGTQAGIYATNAAYSNFMGTQAGIYATGASHSNFMGYQAGYLASNANQSSFIGQNAGYQATGASNSNLFGYNVGNGGVLGSLGSNNIIIGTNISLPSGTTNSINLGGVLFGNNTYSGTTGIPSISAQTQGRIGINVVTPSEALHVSGNIKTDGNLTVTGTTFKGNGSFTKGGYASGDILLDNGSTDSPGVLMYYANNNNYGLDTWNGTYDVLSGQLFRVTNNLNESGGAVKMVIDASGNLVVNGFVKPNAWRAGQTIQTILFSASDLSFNSNYTNNTNTYTSIVTGTYTPLSTSSYIFFEVYAMYDVGGAAADSFFSQITWNGSEIGVQRQVWANGSGGGTRSGTLFPLVGRVTNGSTTGYGWAVNTRRDSSDDGITVYNNSGFYVKITEIAR